MALTLVEPPSEKEKEDLETHVEMCHLRYASISGSLSRIEKVLWYVAAILLAGTISSSMALWLK